MRQSARHPHSVKGRLRLPRADLFPAGLEWKLPCASTWLRSEPVVVVQSVENGPSDELAVVRLRRCQLRVRLRDPVDALVHTGVVVPSADVLVQDGPQLSLVPDEDSV